MSELPPVALLLHHARTALWGSKRPPGKVGVASVPGGLRLRAAGRYRVVVLLQRGIHVG